MGISYSVDVDPDVNATAMLRDRTISLKHSKAIARAIKGKTVSEAQELLQQVVDEEQSVPFKQHNSGVGHKDDIEGWDAGRYPEKAAKAFQDLLHNGVNNADQQGFDGESMVIDHVAPHKVGEVQGRKPRAMGRATDWNSVEVDVELVLVEPESEEAEA